VFVYEPAQQTGLVIKEPTTPLVAGFLCKHAVKVIQKSAFPAYFIYYGASPTELT
jgi:hypothetical protein